MVTGKRFFSAACAAAALALGAPAALAQQDLRPVSQNLTNETVHYHAMTARTSDHAWPEQPVAADPDCAAPSMEEEGGHYPSRHDTGVYSPSLMRGADAQADCAAPEAVSFNHLASALLDAEGQAERLEALGDVSKDQVILVDVMQVMGGREERDFGRAFRQTSRHMDDLHELIDDHDVLEHVMDDHDLDEDQAVALDVRPDGRVVLYYYDGLPSERSFAAADGSEE